MSLSMTRQAKALGVGDMAARLAETDDPAEIATHHRQVRHWTASGLLRPLGDRFSGTGKHRRYSETQLVKAALLAVLVRDYRLSVGVLQYVAQTFDTLDERGWPAILEPGRLAASAHQYYLAIGMRRGEVIGGLQFGPKMDAAAEAFRHGAETAIVVDWSRLLRHVLR